MNCIVKPSTVVVSMRVDESINLTSSLMPRGYLKRNTPIRPPL